MQEQNNLSEHRLGEDSEPYNLMDGATGEGLKVIRELDEQRKISSDSALPLDDRLEAYEDIFDSEVGDTSLVRARNIEREVGLRQIYLKFEGGNPTGAVLIPSLWRHVEITASQWRWRLPSPGCNAGFAFPKTTIRTA